MGKNKPSNPMDAYRKAQRQKELKKNKEARQKSQASKDAKKDPSDLQKRIDALLALPSRTPTQDKEVKELKAEVKKISKAKEDYLKEHPEERDKIIKKPGQAQGDYKSNLKEQVESAQRKGGERNIFKKDGTLVNPKKSVYYDPVYNPYGVPPPGMPYLERPDAEDDDGEDEDEPEGDESDEDDIPLPPGPPPQKEEEDSDDDIPLPDGPPPPKRFKTDDGSPQPLFNRPSVRHPQPNPQHHQQQQHFPPPMPMQMQMPHHVPMHPQYLPPAPFPSHMTAPPVYFPSQQGMPMPPPPHSLPPRPSFPPQRPPHDLPVRPSFPPPPPGFNAPHNPMSIPDASASASSSQPHPLPTPPNPMQKQFGPPPVIQPPPPMISATATISAAPQVRDLKKEAAAFVPHAVKKRKAKEEAELKKRVSSAPEVKGEVGGGLGIGERTERTTLLVELRKGGLLEMKEKETVQVSKRKGEMEMVKDEYESFLEELNGMEK
ncbi:hypothetical protein BT69DRAFT_1331741 [Atractiella rhizophila]|nr:hypothetical protein BT69DRAFT_1331741 [Atractiella rhizophila]